MKKDNSKVLLAELEQKIISYLSEIVDLRQESNQLITKQIDQAKQFASDLIALKDALDVKFDNYNEMFEKTSVTTEVENAINNFKSISRKILRIMETYKIQEINFADQKAKLEMCTIVETRPNPNLEDETILFTLKKGYLLEGKVVRKAEVITVKN